MKMWTDLISTDYGLMSLTVILIVIAMWIYFTVLFMGKISRSPAPPTKSAQDRSKP
ncbi:MAG: DUF3149 domain-containing protein [Comamonas sp.]|nr:DUF3149 domain-containing protein [Candidatus Comamonas equi]